MSQNKGNRLYRQEYVVDDLEVPAEVCVRDVGGFLLIICAVMVIFDMYKYFSLVMELI
jgi:hypothetical protein